MADKQYTFSPETKALVPVMINGQLCVMEAKQSALDHPGRINASDFVISAIREPASQFVPDSDGPTYYPSNYQPSGFSSIRGGWAKVHALTPELAAQIQSKNYGFARLGENANKMDRGSNYLDIITNGVAPIPLNEFKKMVEGKSPPAFVAPKEPPPIKPKASDPKYIMPKPEKKDSGYNGSKGASSLPPPIPPGESLNNIKLPEYNPKYNVTGGISPEQLENELVANRRNGVEDKRDGVPKGDPRTTYNATYHGKSYDNEADMIRARAANNTHIPYTVKELEVMQRELAFKREPGLQKGFGGQQSLAANPNVPSLNKYIELKNSQFVSTQKGIPSDLLNRDIVGKPVVNIPEGATRVALRQKDDGNYELTISSKPSTRGQIITSQVGQHNSKTAIPFNDFVIKFTPQEMGNQLNLTGLGALKVENWTEARDRTRNYKPITINAEPMMGGTPSKLVPPPERLPIPSQNPQSQPPLAPPPPPIKPLPKPKMPPGETIPSPLSQIGNALTQGIASLVGLIQILLVNVNTPAPVTAPPSNGDSFGDGPLGGVGSSDPLTPSPGPRTTPPRPKSR